MKIHHRTPVPSWFAPPESDPVDSGYEREIERVTDRSERECRHVQERLKRAEQRLAKAQAQKQTAAQRKLVKRLEALITARRAELAEIERLMIPVNADKKIMFRTGLDNHLELGVPKRASRHRRKQEQRAS